MTKYPFGNPYKQQGATLVMAIFILVVLALLGVYMARFSGVEQATSTYALQGARAYQAAKAGLGWAETKIIKESGTCAVVNAQSTLTFSDLSGFTVSLGCTSAPYTEGSITLNVYRLSSFSEFGAYGSADYVSRTMEMSMVK
ncbi:hypothetical protein MCAMS1_00726 [biofilm metagenome]